MRLSLVKNTHKLKLVVKLIKKHLLLKKRQLKLKLKKKNLLT